MRFVNVALSFFLVVYLLFAFSLHFFNPFLILLLLDCKLRSLFDISSINLSSLIEKAKKTNQIITINIDATRIQAIRTFPSIISLYVDLALKIHKYKTK